MLGLSTTPKVLRSEVSTWYQTSGKKVGEEKKKNGLGTEKRW